MRLLDKLVFQDLIAPFFTGLLMFLMIIFASTYMFPTTEMLMQGIPPKIVLQVVLYSLPGLITQTFPMSMLLAGLLGFGRLSQDKEAVAILAAGVSFPRVARTVWITGAVVSVISFAWNETVVPTCTKRFLRIKENAIGYLQETGKPLHYTVPAPKGKGIEEFVYIADGYDKATKHLKNVTITHYVAGRLDAEIYCEYATAEDQAGIKWTFYNASTSVHSPSSEYPGTEEVFTSREAILKTLPKGATMGKSIEGILSSTSTDPGQRSFAELRRNIAQESALGQDTRGKQVDLYGKIALPLASLVFGVVGAAMGFNTQRGGNKTVGFGIAIFIVFVYWIFYHSMYITGQNGGLPPLVASFLADIVGGIIGILLSVKASR